MEDFILKNYISLVYFFEATVIVIGLINFKKYKGTAAKYFIYFTIYALIVELLGLYTEWIEQNDSLCWIYYLVEGTIFSRNYWFFQFFWIIVSPLFYSFYYFKVAKSALLKKSIKYVALIFAVVSIALLFINYKVFYTNFYSPISLLGLLIILFLVFSFFIELIQSDSILVFYRSLSFYISVGILVFWLLTIPLEFYEKYYNIYDYGYIYLKFKVYLFSILFMNLSFAVGLIVSNTKNE
ncbi:hypothetical protein ES676_09935 [Bizionia saleffrena]|uniref:Uncharacterized protein n=1 Tax=Bizionia saleffrena TaxID=291189 RepID=A0A8H2LBW4_9FLAO|nr:hypothetical protein ES676_09935 [Bizionia saleffrena]